MNRIKNIFSLFVFAAALTALPSIAAAQWNGGYPNGGYGYPNGGYYRNNIWGNIDNLYRQAKDFEHTVDHTYSKSYANDFRKLVGQFDGAVRDLRNHYGRGNDLSRSSGYAQQVLSLGSEIESRMGYNNGYYGNNGRWGRRNRDYGYGDLQGQWSQIRSNLQVIADAYGSYDNGYRNYPNTGSWRNRPWPY